MDIKVEAYMLSVDGFDFELIIFTHLKNMKIPNWY
jgi:hypothetical protein